jgi:NAD(P)-dependent dehydrogenase (short-subunit alcohol dehydrogenase family)
MPGMPSEPGQDQPFGPAAPGRSRAGQVAVVTGGPAGLGPAGLGLAIAAALAQAGTTVMLASRSAGRCVAAAARLSARTGTAVHGRACDVTGEHAVSTLTEEVLARHGRIDVLVTSAGIQARGTVDQLAVADLRACLVAGVAGTWLACRAAAAPDARRRVRPHRDHAQRAGPGRGRRPVRVRRQQGRRGPAHPHPWPPGWPAPGSPPAPWPPARSAPR